MQVFHWLCNTFLRTLEYHRDWKVLGTDEIDPLIAQMMFETKDDRKAMSILLPESIRETGDDLDQACIMEVDVRFPEGSSSSRF